MFDSLDIGSSRSLVPDKENEQIIKYFCGIGKKAKEDLSDVIDTTKVMLDTKNFRFIPPSITVV